MTERQIEAVEEIEPSIHEIPLANGKKAIVDKSFAHLSDLSWYSDSRGYVYRSFRVGSGQKNRRKMSLHQCVIGCPLNGKQIDHLNGNRLDNRSDNLRIVTSRINNHNKVRYRNGTKTSRFIGVHRRENGKWRAAIRVHQRLYNLGTFAKEMDAAKTYEKAFLKIRKMEERYVGNNCR